MKRFALSNMLVYSYSTVTAVGRRSLGPTSSEIIQRLKYYRLWRPLTVSII